MRATLSYVRWVLTDAAAKGIARRQQWAEMPGQITALAVDIADGMTCVNGSAAAAAPAARRPPPAAADHALRPWSRLCFSAPTRPLLPCSLLPCSLTPSASELCTRSRRRRGGQGERDGGGAGRAGVGGGAAGPRGGLVDAAGAPARALQRLLRQGPAQPPPRRRRRRRPIVGGGGGGSGGTSASTSSGGGRHCPPIMRMMSAPSITGLPCAARALGAVGAIGAIGAIEEAQ